MSTSITCSKLSGWSETGLAFGITCPPMAMTIVRSLADTSCWHASTAACSAFCNHVRKDVGILSVVVSIRKFRQVQRQIVFAHLMERANHATLEQAPEGFNVIGMNVPTHVFFLGVIHDFMREIAGQSLIAGMLIRRNQGNRTADSLPDELAHGGTVSGFDDFADHIALASDSPDYRDFSTRARNMFPLVGVTVDVLPADKSFINFHFSHELTESAILHGCTNAMAHIPGGLVGSAPDQSLDLQGADPFLALKHQIDHLKPCLERIVSIFKNRFTDDGKAITVSSTAFLRFADPMKWACLQCVHFVVVAARTLHAVWPASFLQELFAGLFSGEAIHGLRERHFGFHDLASVMLRPLYPKLGWVSCRL